MTRGSRGHGDPHDAKAVEQRAHKAASGWRRYPAVLAVPTVRSLMFTGMVGRLPLGMMALSIVLLSRSTGSSYAAVGWRVGVFTLGAALAGPLMGRLMDRLGELWVLAPASVLFPLAVFGLAFAIGSRGLAVAVFAFGAGATLPPLEACMRALWPRLLPVSLHSTAYALDAIVQECVFIAGPLIVAALAVLSPGLTLPLAGAAGGIGAAFFVGLLARSARSREWLPVGPERRALGSPGLRTIMLTSAAMGAAFGAVEVTMPAFAEHHGTSAGSGILLAAFALGSVVGGAWFGSQASSQRAQHNYIWAVAAFGLMLAAPLMAGSLVSMALLMLLVGLPVAPAFSAAYVLVAAHAPAGGTTESFAWLSTSVVAGAAVGNAVGGTCIGTFGYRGGVAFAIASASAGFLIGISRKATLLVPVDRSPITPLDCGQ